MVVVRVGCCSCCSGMMMMMIMMIHQTILVDTECRIGIGMMMIG